MDAARQRLGQERLAHPGHVLDEQVPLGEQGQHDQVHHRPLALDDTLDVGGDRVETLGEPGQFLLADGCLSHDAAPPGEGLGLGQVISGCLGGIGGASARRRDGEGSGPMMLRAICACFRRLARPRSVAGGVAGGVGFPMQAVVAAATISAGVGVSALAQVDHCVRGPGGRGRARRRGAVLAVAAQAASGVKGAGAVAAQSLREQLLALPGVGEVELDGEGEAPAGVRIRLAADADADGWASRCSGCSRPTACALGWTTARRRSPRPCRWWSPPRRTESEAVAAASAPARPACARLQSVRVEESASGVAVTVVAADGRQVTRDAGCSDEATGDRGHRPPRPADLRGAAPRVVVIEWIDSEGSRAVTVVLESARRPARRRGGGGAGCRGPMPSPALAWSALTT